MHTVDLNLEDGLYLSDVQPDVATGCARLEGVDQDGGYVRWVPVMATSEFTVPLTFATTAEDALRLAAAIIEWDSGMMEQADAPFVKKGPSVPAR